MNNFDNAFDKFILRDDMTIKEIFKAGWNASLISPISTVHLTRDQVLIWCKDIKWPSMINPWITPPSGWAWFSDKTNTPFTLRCKGDPSIPDVCYPSPTVPLTREQVLEDATVYLHDWPLPNFKPVTRYQGWEWVMIHGEWALNRPYQLAINKGNWWELKCQL